MAPSVVSRYLSLALFVVSCHVVNGYDNFLTVGEEQNHNMLRRQDPIEEDIYDYDFEGGEQQRRELYAWGFSSMLCKYTCISRYRKI
jgi:hypothetical protein